MAASQIVTIPTEREEKEPPRYQLVRAKRLAATAKDLSYKLIPVEA